MRKAFTIIAIAVFTISLFLPCWQVIAQSPQKMSYQAVIRNSSDHLVTDQVVGIKISILKGSSSGSNVYVETHMPTSNANGLVTIEIGGGTIVTGTFSGIDWSDGPYFIKTEIDPAGGTSYTITGTSQLLSVPYALYAKMADSVVNENQTLTLDEGELKISGTGGNTVTFANWDKDWSNDVRIIGDQTIDGNKTFTGTTTVSPPVNSTDAATKAYVDALLQQISNSGAIVVDADGNVYSTVRIGSQVWMAENLKTTKYNDGSDIPYVTDAAAWMNLTTPAYCWYNNQIPLKGTIGALYNWYTVNTGMLCPTGWHEPTDEEWTTLDNYLMTNGFNYDGTTTGNKYAKAISKGSAPSHITGAIGNSDYPEKKNVTGFAGIPFGGRSSAGYFDLIGYDGYWWSSSEFNTDRAYSRSIDYESVFVQRNHFPKGTGFSVRCLRDD